MRLLGVQGYNNFRNPRGILLIVARDIKNTHVFYSFSIK